MISRTIAVDGVATRVTFGLHRVLEKAALIGDFHDWDAGALPVGFRRKDRLAAASGAK